MTEPQTLHLAIRPIDTLMFRDGRPFNQGDPGASEAVSLFPPAPPTIAGILRSAFATELGWSGTGDWSPEIKASLGNGVNWQKEENALGTLCFTAATVVVEGTAYYPAPRTLLAPKAGRGTGKMEITFLRPGPASQSDLGAASLPVPDLQTNGTPYDGLDTLEGWWISRAGLGHVLGGAYPGAYDLKSPDHFWQREPRVGIGINGVGADATGVAISNLATRRPVDGALYMASHTRVRDGVELRVTVTSIHADGLKIDGGHCLSPAGGEHRMAELEVCTDPPELPPSPKPLKRPAEKVRYTVYHAAPCFLDAWPKPGEHLGDLPGEVVSACLGKAQMIGGWDTRARGPIAMTACIPAGSVWFVEAESQDAATILARHGSYIGRSTAWGFGQILIGTW